MRSTDAMGKRDHMRRGRIKGGVAGVIEYMGKGRTGARKRNVHHV